LATSSTRQAAPPLTLEAARAHVAGRALTATAVGPVGLELEFHLVDLDAPDVRVPWARVRAAVEALPVLPGGSRVTLEPGGQVELSGPPCRDAGAAVAALRADRAVVAAALGKRRLALAALGTDPLRPPGRVDPRPRYTAMEQHFASVGCPAAGAARAYAAHSSAGDIPPGTGPQRA
jgi:glutamate--cysteine ligase